MQQVREQTKEETGYSETTKNILFTKTIQILSQGLEYEEKGLLEPAVASYVRYRNNSLKIRLMSRISGLDMLMELIQSTY
jgi:hypothetical protein